MSLTEIIRAVSILRSGGLVAFPTETVYGLGADATDAAAVQRIYTAKGRPGTNPLICHVADEPMARRYAADWPLAASRLAEAFWPGPLTLVVPKTNKVVSDATAGLDSVGLRAPNHPLTLQLLRIFDRPLAGPSANRSNHVSPTTADHVRAELGSSIDIILDGGPCEVGIESTVLDLAAATPTILRPGGVSKEQLESVIGPVDLKAAAVTPNTPATSPGQQPVHYAPYTPAYRFEMADSARIPAEGVMRVGTLGTIQRQGTVSFMPIDPAAYAHEFYAALRELDAMNLSAIYIEIPPDTPEWLAVRDRIFRATKPLP